jgi:ferredoxin
MTEQEFIAQWDMENMPACDEGMALLKLFADRHPDSYKFVRPQDFSESNNPAFAAIPEWDAFTEHCSSCETCREV